MRRSRLKRTGKRTKLWIKVRAEWLRLNPPDHYGGYLCGLCGKWVHKDDMELDHIKSRSSRPDLFDKLDNLQPTHSWCNRKKGSAHVEPLVTTSEYELRRLLKL